MARIKLQAENSDEPLIKEIFAEIKSKAGKVPPAYRAFALHPHILQANWNRTKNILGKGRIPLSMKEAIALRVSKENGCDFCVEIHKANLAKCGFGKDEVSAVMDNHGVKDEKLAFVLIFVSRATKNPKGLADSDFAKLREFGFMDEDILEILTVMEMYTGYNKIITALNIQLGD